MSSGAVIRSLVRNSSYLFGLLEPVNARMVEARWRRQACPIPVPPSVKRNILRRVARQHNLRVLIETGTYLGDTVMALRREFDRIVSIELSPELHAKAAHRARRERNIQLFSGDSASVLPGILATLNEPALFWLDAHYAGTGTALGDEVSPISTELDAVLGHPIRKHMVLIDDAREFHACALSGYPSPEVVKEAALKHDYALSEKHDIFFLRAKSPGEGSIGASRRA